MLVCYYTPGESETLEYITGLAEIPQGTIIAGDFNIYNPIFYPGTESKYSRQYLAD